MVETYVKNEDAWAHGRLLLVGKQQFIVDRNPPTVEKVRAADRRCCQTSRPILTIWHCALKPHLLLQLGLF